jgi:hypothetical protein
MALQIPPPLAEPKNILEDEEARACALLHTGKGSDGQPVEVVPHLVALDAAGLARCLGPPYKWALTRRGVRLAARFTLAYIAAVEKGGP